MNQVEVRPHERIKVRAELATLNPRMGQVSVIQVEFGVIPPSYDMKIEIFPEP